MPKPKELEDLEDDDEQGAQEIKGKDDDEEKVAAQDDDEIDVDKPSEDDSAETKAERRKARYREIEERANAAEERARAADERAARLEAQFQGFQQGYRRDETPQKDETEERINALMEKRQRTLMLIRTSVGDENATAALARESQEIEGEIQNLRMDRAIRRHMAENQQPSVNVEMRILQSETPQVYSDPGIKAWAQGEFSRLVRNGAPGTIDTARKANQAALRAFGLARGPAPVPSSSQRRAVGGMSSGGGGGTTPSGKVKLPKSLRKIAAARAALLSPNDDEHATNKKFAKRLREKGIA